MSQDVDRSPSPDSETFSTPPTSPGILTTIPASLSRRNSRPSSLCLDHKQSDWNPDIELLTPSPDPTKKVNGATPLPQPISEVPAIIAPSSAKVPLHTLKPVNSPCFVHSHLDKGAQLTDWLKNKQSFVDSSVGVAKSLQHPASAGRSSTTKTSAFESSNDSGDDDDDEFAGSLTKRLAETAVGVREMSKQLGRARVQSNIQTVLIVTKARDNRLIKLTRELALYLMLKHRRGSKRGLVVYVDSQLRHSRRFNAEGIQHDHPELFEPFPKRRPSSNNHSVSSLSSTLTQKDATEDGQLRYWTSSMCRGSPHLFDFVVTLGGDGTVLFTSWLFQRIVPPVLSFALGSLGFLTNFDFVDHQAVMDSAIDNGIRVNLRMRFTCTIYRAVANEEGKGRKAVKKGETGEIMMKNLEKGGWEALEGGWAGGYAMGDTMKCGGKDKEIMCFTTRPVETFEVLNDLVVDRGLSPYVSQLELFGDEHHMTTVQADGLTVSTPTGSTAYSLSAGGSLVHPEIPAILITPICPHTLSFRPMLLPDSMELRICVPYNSRSTAWASFDGRGRVELKQGDHIKVTASKYPFPTVCADKQSTDWFHSISRTLKWNERERQKSFVVVEEGPQKRTTKKKSERKNEVVLAEEEEKAPAAEVKPPLGDVHEEEDESSDEEEEDTFDIDDSSPEAETKPKVGAGEKEKVSTHRVQRPLSSSPTVVKRKLHKSRSRSRSPTSGVDSPGRFASPAPPHPHVVSPRHVGFHLPIASGHGQSSGSASSSSSSDSLVSSSSHTAQAAQGTATATTRDELHLHLPPSRHVHPRSSRILLPPKDSKELDLDLDLEAVKTPTPSSVQGRGRGRSRSRSRSSSDQREHVHRAFAVWGQDENESSDGNARS